MINKEETYSFEDIGKIYEANGKSLRRRCWSDVAERSKKQNLKCEFIRVAKNGDIIFKTESGTLKGKYYTQIIRFVDIKRTIKQFLSDVNYNSKNIVKLLYNGDIKIYCDDPSFKYYFQYVAWKKGFGIKGERRKPKIRNPRYSGGVCKHLYTVLVALPYYYKKIIKGLIKWNFLPKEYTKFT